MVVRAGDRTDEFEALRPRLQAVAYRLTGSVADAEDIVQDAWLRLYSTTAEIEDLAAWLTTVVSRLGLDRLRSAVYRRETYVGNGFRSRWSPAWTAMIPWRRWWPARTRVSLPWWCWIG